MDQALFAEFEAASHDDWLEAARVSLRGGRLESLVARSYEGIDIDPLVGAEVLADGGQFDTLPGQFHFRRGASAAGYRGRPWLIAQEIDIAEPRAFNAALREALAEGQTAIVLGDGLRTDSPDDLRRALAGINLRDNPVFIRSDSRARRIYRLLQKALSRVEFGQVRGCAGYDPLANLARTGMMRADALEHLAALAEDADKCAPQLGSISVGTRVYHEAGANAVQELAIALATAVEYLRALDERGLGIDLVASKMQVQLSIGENFFMEVAKFRAMKPLWAQVMRACGVGEAGQGIQLHGRSGARNKTRRDRQVNLLRLTTEALAAAIGGIDSLTIAPFDEAWGKPDGFSRRLSRNLQLILQEEVRLTEVIDPAGGAWHVERLTDELARRAWGRFQAIEAAGGMLGALQAGAIQREIEVVAEQRRRDAASGAAILVGVNAYENPEEAMPAIGPRVKPEARDEAGEPWVTATPLVPLRLEEAGELPRASGKGV